MIAELYDLSKMHEVSVKARMTSAGMTLVCRLRSVGEVELSVKPHICAAVSPTEQLRVDLPQETCCFSRSCWPFGALMFSDTSARGEFFIIALTF